MLGFDSPWLHTPLPTSWLLGEYRGNITVYKASNNIPSESRQPLESGHISCPLIDFPIDTVHFEPLRSGHLPTLDNGHQLHPRLVSANAFLPRKADSETTPTNINFNYYAHFTGSSCLQEKTNYIICYRCPSQCNHSMNPFNSSTLTFGSYSTVHIQLHG